MTGNNNSNTTNVNVAETIVVTRHLALIDYLREIGVVTGDAWWGFFRCIWRRKRETIVKRWGECFSRKRQGFLLDVSTYKRRNSNIVSIPSFFYNLILFFLILFFNNISLYDFLNNFLLILSNPFYYYRGTKSLS